MYLCREVANMTFPQIGIDFGNRDHSTVMHAYKKIEKDPRIRIIKLDIDEFNYSKLINFGVKNSDGDFILQLNNDTKVLTTNWLELLIGYAQNKEIGAVRS